MSRPSPQMRLRRPSWRAAARGGALWWTAPSFLVFSVLRLPSFFEPHWYTDEASYVNVAKSLLRGRVLYSQIWNNKPPLQSWTIATEVRFFGASEFGLHLLTYLTGLAALAALAYAATRILGVRRACVATLLCAIALGLPVVDAELALPESLLIAPVTWAGALLLVRIDPRRLGSAPPRRLAIWPFVVGALVAAGIAYQQTVVAEATAFGLIIALSPRTRWRDLVAYVGTVVVITAGWVAVAMATAGASKLAFALVGFYIPYTRSVLPSAGSGVVMHIAEVGIAAILLCVGAFLCRRLSTPAWAVVLWAGAALLVAAMAGQPYAHYLTAAAAPVSLAVAAIPLPNRLRSFSRANTLRLVPAVAALAIAAALARVTGLDWVPEAAPSPAQNSSRTLTQYYGGAVRAAFSGDDSDWDGQFDAHVPADAAVASWISQHGYSGASAVIWSSDSWVYSLADLDVLMPTPPIYNDEVLLGNNGPVATAVANINPMLIIVSADAESQWPEISGILAGGAYQRVFGSGQVAIWLRNGS
ncbi:MAG: glycosyltransferase family 39 protein [Candidatus Dormibacteraeota bacterium]|nr:glycosyltransferase family 39 protein [Candidatus Dormibacteraeota bacterium]